MEKQKTLDGTNFEEELKGCVVKQQQILNCDYGLMAVESRA